MQADFPGQDLNVRPLAFPVKVRKNLHRDMCEAADDGWLLHMQTLRLAVSGRKMKCRFCPDLASKEDIVYLFSECSHY